MFSEPLGFDASSPTLNENLSKLNEIEANIDMYLYSWKFLETFVIRPRESPNNVAVNRDDTSQKYFYISFDNDVTFGHRRYTCEQPNAYSIIYLTNQMELSFDPQIVKELLYLDLEMLFSEWIEKFKLKNRNLFGPNCLFDSNELSLIKKEIGAVYEGKSISCDLDACFTDADLISLFNRLEKVKQILINKKKLKFQNKRIQLDNFQSHFDLLQQLDPIDFDYYKKAFASSNDYHERFNSLPGFDQNFTIIIKEDEEVVISSKSNQKYKLDFVR